MEFERYDIKAAINFKKRGVSFEEAKSVFYDDYAYIFDDIFHSENENRELLFGNFNKNRLLIVSYTDRNNIVRIISTRKATKHERKLYEER